MADGWKMARAEVDADEWRNFRLAALDRGVSVQVLLGDVIREYLAKMEYEKAAAKVAR